MTQLKGQVYHLPTPVKHSPLVLILSSLADKTFYLVLFPTLYTIYSFQNHKEPHPVTPSCVVQTVSAILLYHLTLALPLLWYPIISLNTQSLRYNHHQYLIDTYGINPHTPIYLQGAFLFFRKFFQVTLSFYPFIKKSVTTSGYSLCDNALYTNLLIYSYCICCE